MDQPSNPDPPRDPRDPRKGKAGASKKPAKGKKRPFKAKFTPQQMSILEQAAGIIAMCSDPASRRWAAARITSVANTDNSSVAAKPNKGKSASKGKAKPTKKGVQTPKPTKSDRREQLMRVRSLRDYFASERSRFAKTYLKLKKSKAALSSTDQEVKTKSGMKFKVYHKLYLVGKFLTDLILGTKDDPGIPETARLIDGFLRSINPDSVDIVKALVDSHHEDPDYQLNYITSMLDELEQYVDPAMVDLYLGNRTAESTGGEEGPSTPLENLLQDNSLVDEVPYMPYLNKLYSSMVKKHQIESPEGAHDEAASGAGEQ